MIKKLSIILPVYNEQDSIEQVLVELDTIVENELKKYSTEVVIVNDGSTDNTFQIVTMFAKKRKKYRVLNLARNFGQSSAIACGIDNSKSEIVVIMDSDGQNDPRDIGKLLHHVENGFDLVSGWRVNRVEKAFLRKYPSRIANMLISKVSGVKIHDFGCSLKAYRREYLSQVHMYGDIHRFLAAYVSFYGGRTIEIEVNHRPRIGGHSKYTFARTYRVLLDLILAAVFRKFRNRPLHFFGGIGSMFIITGIAVFTWSIIAKLYYNLSFVDSPLPILGSLFSTVGFQFIGFGVISELNLRNNQTNNSLKSYILSK